MVKMALKKQHQVALLLARCRGSLSCPAGSRRLRAVGGWTQLAALTHCSLTGRLLPSLASSRGLQKEPALAGSSSHIIIHQEKKILLNTEPVKQKHSTCFRQDTPLESQEGMNYVEASEDGELPAAIERRSLPLEKHSTHLPGHCPLQSQSAGRPTPTEGLLGAELQHREMSLLIFLSAAALRGLGIKEQLLLAHRPRLRAQTARVYSTGPHSRR